jgi:hypothetical protein
VSGGEQKIKNPCLLQFAYFGEIRTEVSGKNKNFKTVLLQFLTVLFNVIRSQ